MREQPTSEDEMSKKAEEMATEKEKELSELRETLLKRKLNEEDLRLLDLCDLHWEETTEYNEMMQKKYHKEKISGHIKDHSIYLEKCETEKGPVLLGEIDDYPIKIEQTKALWDKYERIAKVQTEGINDEIKRVLADKNAEDLISL